MNFEYLSGPLTMDPLPRRAALNMQSVQTSGDPTGHRAVFTVQSSQCSLHTAALTHKLVTRCVRICAHSHDTLTPCEAVTAM